MTDEKPRNRSAGEDDSEADADIKLHVCFLIADLEVEVVAVGVVAVVRQEGDDEAVEAVVDGKAGEGIDAEAGAAVVGSVVEGIPLFFRKSRGGLGGSLRFFVLFSGGEERAAVAHAVLQVIVDGEHRHHGGVEHQPPL